MATGIEVVGVVLGIIPLVIEGIKTYRTTYDKSTTRGMRRVFGTLITEIETEETILRELYVGLRDEAEINWKKEGTIEKKVDLLLGDCSKSFTRTAQSMKEAIEELKETLGIGPNGEILDRSLFARLKLVWSEADLDKLISRLRRDSERLMAMVDLSQKRVTREPKSRKTKQASMLGVARNLLRTACNALSQAMTCACAEPHNINLRIEAYASQLLCHEDIEELASTIPIHVIVLFDIIGQPQSNHPWHWEEMLLKKHIQLPINQGNTDAQPPLKRSKRVLFTGKIASTASSSGMKAKPTLGNQGDDELIVSVCDALCRKQCLPNTDYYGYIIDNSANNAIKFTIRPTNSYQNNHWAVLTLRDVLMHQGKTLPGLRYFDKMKLAALVARALLQLSGSSWTPEVMTSESFVILISDNTTVYDSIYVSPCAPLAQPPSLQLDLPVNYTKDEQRLIALGITLIELMLGTHWEQIRASAESTSDREIAQNKLRDLREVNEFCYLAIKYCINLEVVGAKCDLESQEFRKEVYERVVGRFEDNLDGNI
ncbi:hypothetical protein PG995_010900 [Apiospora arundinis]